jgi:DNA-binding NarL/FixJ family response regulator
MHAHKAHDVTKENINLITLWIVEDDDLYRTAIAHVLNTTEGMRCEHALRSCEEMLEVLKTQFAPEVVLMDIGLPGLSGIEGVRRIKDISPATDVLMLTIHEEDDKVFEAICAGANGYLLKSLGQEELLQAIRGVMAGGAPMNAQIAARVLHMFARIAAPKEGYGLTAREKEILSLLTEGLSKKAIADRLFLSFFTIDTHLKNIYSKLHVHSGTGAVAKALRERIL